MLYFNPNCTLPSGVVNYVASPNARGTLDIFWASITTLFLCTWTVQHPNLPIERPPRSIKARVSALTKKVGMMIATLIAPEFLLLKAIGDKSCATILDDQIGWRAERDLSRWSSVHSFFANMGGFVVHFTDETPQEPALLQETPPSPIPPTTTVSLTKTTTPSTETTFSEATATISFPQHLAHSNVTSEQESKTAIKVELIVPSPLLDFQEEPSYLTPHGNRLLRLLDRIERGLPPSDEKTTMLVKESLAEVRRGVKEGQSFYMSRSPGGFGRLVYNLVRLRGTKWALDGAQIVLAHQMGIISKFPDVSKEELEDKSKGDFLVKFLAVIQAGWQIVQLLKRYVQHETPSQLEIVTIAYAVCTLFIYMFYWEKPQDISVPFLLPAARYATVEEVIKLADIGPIYTAGLFTGYDYAVPEHTIHTNFEHPHEGHSGGRLGWVGGVIGAVVFGLLHCAAWNLSFPTPIERLLWRYAAIFTTSIPFVYGARGLILPWLIKAEMIPGLAFIGDTMMPVLGTIVGSTYGVSRLFLLLETFRSLFYLSPETFKS